MHLEIFHMVKANVKTTELKTRHVTVSCVCDRKYTCIMHYCPIDAKLVLKVRPILSLLNAILFSILLRKTERKICDEATFL